MNRFPIDFDVIGVAESRSLHRSCVFEETADQDFVIDVSMQTQNLLDRTRKLVVLNLGSVFFVWRKSSRFLVLLQLLLQKQFVVVSRTSEEGL